MKKLLYSTLFCLSALPLLAEETISVALDWTPNSNHVGLYVAQALGWFEEADLDVDILPYTDTSSTVLVASGVAQFGVLDGVSLHTQRSSGADVIAVMAIVQHETGRLVFNADRGDIQRPADLDGLIYGGFGSEWESSLVAKMIQYDGGQGEFETVTLGTSTYEALDNGSIDFTLEIKTWEGVIANLTGRNQRGFEYSDFGVPDMHTTYMGADETWLQQNGQTAIAFIQAVQRGYEFANENPVRAAELLIEESAGMLTNPELVVAAVQALSEGGYLQDPGEALGEIDPEMFLGITDFLYDERILRDDAGEVLSERPNATDWFTNDFLIR
ncbi:myristoyl transferase [Tateyamaria omphalii]|uniref:ABC transporter substrate-binding protein n=1 Tax=Tateyamaria omphalii TaxID=299262 RepID=UPI0016720CC3|nr:ABC transporter substrate-binding protein [Tateyamaria omphalii]GGX70962.1 myristoyl transferase [Tateyamaria omphalii]